MIKFQPCKVKKKWSKVFDFYFLVDKILFPDNSICYHSSGCNEARICVTLTKLFVEYSH